MARMSRTETISLIPGPCTSVDVAEILPSPPAESYQANGIQPSVTVTADPSKPHPPVPGHFLPKVGGAAVPPHMTRSCPDKLHELKILEIKMCSITNSVRHLSIKPKDLLTEHFVQGAGHSLC